MRYKFKIWSIWEFEQWRKITDPLGHIRWMKIAEWTDGNIVTDEGINYLLDEFFDEATQITDWRLAIFEDDYTPLSTDTYAVPGFTECQTLQETSRPQWQPAAASGKSITNSSNKASFTFSIGKTIYGGAMIGGGTEITTIADVSGGGILFCASKFTNGSQGVVANDVIKVTCSISGASG